MKLSIVTKEMSFQLLLEDWQDPAFRIGVGRSFHQPGMVNVNVLESDFEPLCDGTTRRRSIADLADYNNIHYHSKFCGQNFLKKSLRPTKETMIHFAEQKE